MTTPNRRKSTRAPIEVKVDYRTIGSFITDYSKDISQGGIFIATSMPYNIGDQIRLRITLPGSVLPFSLEGVVRWVVQPGAGDKQPGMGLEFVSFTDDVKAELGRLVASLEQG